MIVNPWTGQRFDYMLGMQRMQIQNWAIQGNTTESPNPWNFFFNHQSWLLKWPDSCCAPEIRIFILGQQQLRALASLHRPGDGDWCAGSQPQAPGFKRSMAWSTWPQHKITSAPTAKSKLSNPLSYNIAELYWELAWPFEMQIKSSNN